MGFLFVFIMTKVMNLRSICSNNWEVSAGNPYKEFGINPKKLECIGHVQKRLSTCLRELRKSHKSSPTPLSGRGKLTDKVINSLQNFYGIAIRENQGQLYKVKKAVGAILTI